MEVLDVYNEEGKRLNKKVFRGSNDQDFEKGEHFAVSVIFIENSNGEFLIQKTPKGKYTATGGHVQSSEDPRNAIIRETKEELGIDISNEKFVDLGFRVLDFPIRFLYYLKKDYDINDFHLQKSEVESVSYMSVYDIYKLIEENTMKKGHALLFREIMKYKFKTSSLNDILMKYKDYYDISYPRNDVNYLILKFKSNKNKYKLFIGNDVIQLLKKKKFFSKEYYSLLKEYKKINNYDELCDLIDSITEEYERK